MENIVSHAPNSDRVRGNTSRKINDRIDRQIKERLQRYAPGHGPALNDRIDELQREWDFERLLETEASIIALTGLALAMAVDRRFLIVPGMIAAMVFLHASQGWYPLLPLFRRLGVRNHNEIEYERYALKALRGDFAGVTAAQNERAEAAWEAVLK